MYFLFLKLLLIIQTGLILFQLENPNKISYIKLSKIITFIFLGLFIS
jgi:hypothetical protein